MTCSQQWPLCRLGQFTGLVFFFGFICAAGGNIAKLARKYLCVCATATDSEEFHSLRGGGGRGGHRVEKFHYLLNKN